MHQIPERKQKHRTSRPCLQECGVVWGTVRTLKGAVGELRSRKGNKSHILERRIEHEKTTIRWDYFNVMVLQTC